MKLLEGQHFFAGVASLDHRVFVRGNIGECTPRRSESHPRTQGSEESGDRHSACQVDRVERSSLVLKNDGEAASTGERNK